MATQDLQELLNAMPDIAKAVNEFISHEVQREAFHALIASLEHSPEGSRRTTGTKAKSELGHSTEVPGKEDQAIGQAHDDAIEVQEARRARCGFDAGDRTEGQTVTSGLRDRESPDLPSNSSRLWPSTG